MSTLFKRIGDVINANISDLVDRVEDPEKMVKQMIREMEDNLRQAKEAVIDAVAGEKKLGAELEQHRASARNWRDKARHAVEGGDDYLARESLKRALEHDRVLENLEPAWTAAAETSGHLKSQLRALETKLDEAKRTREGLVARQRAAKARQQIQRVSMGITPPVDATVQFSRMRDKVGDMEARAAAVVEVNGYESSVDAALQALTADADVEAELATMKTRQAHGAT